LTCHQLRSQDTKLQPSVATRSSSKISTEMLQPVADDSSTVTKAEVTATTAALQAETERQTSSRHAQRE
jgi:hypothetical protein